MSTSSLYDLEVCEERLRGRVRDIAGASLGTIISSVLATYMPWVAGSVGINFAKLGYSSYKFHKLKSLFKELGIKIKKRWIFKGIMEGIVKKLGTTVVFFSHDDYVELAEHADSWISHAGKRIAGHESTSWSSFDRWISSVYRTADGLVRADKTRDSIRFIHMAGKAAEMPVQGWQHIAGTHDNMKRGWHAPGGDLAKSVVVVGSAYVAADMICDRVIEKPYDKTRQSVKSFRSKVKKWFRDHF